MRRLLQTLLLVAVFLCGVHPGEPAQAHEDPAQHLLHLDSHMPDTGDDGAPADAEQVPAAGHQHCPMSAGDHFAPVACTAPHNASLLFARPAATLASLTRAPPVEPPAA